MLNELLFETGPALKVIFEIGFEPKEEEFYEFTEEHYEKFHREVGDTSEKMYMLLPKDYRHLSAHEVIAVTETERNSLLKANQIIDRYCLGSGKKFNTYEDKLRYAAKMLPSVFSENTKFSG